MATQSFDDLWTRYMGAGVTSEAYAAEGWDMARILRDLRELWGNHPTDRLDPAELLDVANDIAAGLEERGLGPAAPAAEVDAMTGSAWQYVTVASVKDGRLILQANTEEAARPWLALLELAGVAVTRTPNGGYAFTFSDRPDLAGNYGENTVIGRPSDD